MFLNPSDANHLSLRPVGHFAKSGLQHCLCPVLAGSEAWGWRHCRAGA